MNPKHETLNPELMIIAALAWPGPSIDSSLEDASKLRCKVCGFMVYMGLRISVHGSEIQGLGREFGMYGCARGMLKGRLGNLSICSGTERRV